MRTLVVLMVHTALTACTLVTIEGNDNTISDTGGHGGMVLSPQPQPQGLSLPWHLNHQGPGK